MEYIGIDVSKQKLDVAWLRDATTVKVKCKVFSNDEAGHNALRDWIKANVSTTLADVHLIMEATGVYHEAIAYFAHRNNVKVSVVNPAQIADFRKSLAIRHKNDKKDSIAIARFGAALNPVLWQPEPEEIRILKALLTRLHSLETDIRREANRLEKHNASPSSTLVGTSIQSVLSHLQQEKQKLEKEIDDHIDQYPGLKEDRRLLESIPGVGNVLSRMMISVIRSRPFDNARQCAAFLGLTPTHYESGSSVRGRSKLSKTGNPMVRAKLYMAAVVSTQYNADITALYQRLVTAGKTKMSALGAAMRKLVHICFGVLKHQKPYQPQCC